MNEAAAVARGLETSWYFDRSHKFPETFGGHDCRHVRVESPVDLMIAVAFDRHCETVKEAL